MCETDQQGNVRVWPSSDKHFRHQFISFCLCFIQWSSFISLHPKGTINSSRFQINLILNQINRVWCWDEQIAIARAFVCWHSVINRKCNISSVYPKWALCSTIWYSDSNAIYFKLTEWTRNTGILFSLVFDYYFNLFYFFIVLLTCSNLHRTNELVSWASPTLGTKPTEFWTMRDPEYLITCLILWCFYFRCNGLSLIWLQPGSLFVRVKTEMKPNRKTNFKTHNKFDQIFRALYLLNVYALYLVKIKKNNKQIPT